MVIRRSAVYVRSLCIALFLITNIFLYNIIIIIIIIIISIIIIMLLVHRLTYDQQAIRSLVCRFMVFM